jgi:hypothetical protein
MDVENREKDADPNGWSANEFIAIERSYLHNFTIRRRHRQTRPHWNAPVGIAEEVRNEAEQDCRRDGKEPGTPAREQSYRQQGPTHDLQFGQSPSRERQFLSPSEGVVAAVPFTRHSIAAEFQVARVENLMGSALGAPTAEGRHAGDIQRPKLLQEPSPPPSPPHFDAVANPTSGLDAYDVRRKWLRDCPVGGGFGTAHKRSCYLFQSLLESISTPARYMFIP